MLHAMKSIWNAWKGLAHGIITLQNGVLLAVVFVFGLTPSALIARITGRKLLDRGPFKKDGLKEGEEPDTHWKPLPEQQRDLETTQRPF